MTKESLKKILIEGIVPAVDLTVFESQNKIDDLAWSMAKAMILTEANLEKMMVYLKVKGMIE